MARAEFSETLSLPAPEDMTPKEWEKLLSISEEISAWAKGVAVYVKGRAECGLVRLPNYKLVKTLKNRSWKDEAKALAALEAAGVDPYEKKLISPAKAEKAGLSKKVTATLTERKENGLALVLRSNKAPEVIPDAAIEFASASPLLG